MITTQPADETFLQSTYHVTSKATNEHYIHSGQFSLNSITLAIQ